ncbi:putative UDP-glucose,sterol transferase [Talaromyces proteolyticus]|uniref:UDP-glucose,sterol transferase n=1 Tax=Talaromyces proteolyticus TaxID=1131652 RepID=A0AAD4KSY5_9EURO|nr:putative UDP-glucose,sterol transferase [Talaromyces proteolyticus]KAH8698656.1 putative UDP-glucose,sterol transferase [Talaromyces proteolyticus]
MSTQEKAGLLPEDDSENRLSRLPTQEDVTVGEEVPKPVYSNVYGHMDLTGGGLSTQATITADGRVDIDIKGRTSWLQSAFKLPAFKPSSTTEPPPPYVPPSLQKGAGKEIPRLNIVIHVVGSRGDVQPFIALGQVLKRDHGHRVRLATHPTFQLFVEENGLEFFSIGGDPAELMAFMVKNPGLMPGIDALKNGDISRRRFEIAEIVSGCWRSCFEAGDGTGVPVSDQNADLRNFQGTSPPFVADAIIANPPSFAHVHCAEKLGIPLHMMFTMPWSPTQAFPHPLASIGHSNADPGISNYVTYALVEMLTWQGLGDIINRFREKSLGLEPISIVWAPSMIPRMRIPYTYCWSPALIPKPNDWAGHIDISGFYFLSLASDYTPPEDLAAFLAAGPPPIYIGFGSIVVDDPNEMTRLIFDAVRITGQRTLVSKGWGGLGAEELGMPDNVYMIGNCPHDWLFQRVSCVVHHGGAGTTAAGIALGRPTVVIPFFGDQPFWGAMIGKAGAGPNPIPYKQLTAEKLAAAIKHALEPTTLEKAAELGARIRGEQGTEEGALSFQRQLNVDKMRCSLAPERVAVFRLKRTRIRLSALAFTILNTEGLVELEDVKLYRSKEYMTEADPTDPVIGGGVALLGNIEGFIMGFADLSHDLKRGFNTKAPGTRSPRSGSKPSSRASSPASNKTEGVEDGQSRKSISDSSTLVSPRPDTDGASETGLRHRSATVTTARTDFTSSSGISNTGSETRLNPKIDLDAVVSAGKSAAKIFNLGFRAPADFTMAVAKGFHNAPLLYHDETVRESPKVTGIKSGLKAAGMQFGYGFYDGISGLATQPVQGAKKEGAAGAIKGFTKGIGGLILKPAAGVWALTGYTLSGVYKEIQKRFGESVENYIMASRFAQGISEAASCTVAEKDSILRHWKLFEPEFLKKKAARLGLPKPQDQAASPTVATIRKAATMKDVEREDMMSDRSSLESGQAADRARRRQALRDVFRGRSNSSPSRFSRRSLELPVEYEEAIQNSVHETSQGDATEDEMIERALRASMVELQAAEAAGEEEQQAYNRALEASIREAERMLAEQKRRREDLSPNSRLRFSSRTVDVLQQHGRQPPELPGRKPEMEPLDSDEDPDLRAALVESRESYEESIRREQREKSELDMVIEYVKRQSLAESEYSQQKQETSRVEGKNDADTT